MIGIKSLKKKSLTRSILRILGLSNKFEELAYITDDGTHISAFANDNGFDAYAWKINEDALTEVERKKAEALIEKQQRFIY